MCPGVVATAQSRGLVEKGNYLVPDPVTYVRSAVATIGIQNTTFGYLPHAFHVCIATFSTHSHLLICSFILFSL